MSSYYLLAFLLTLTWLVPTADSHEEPAAMSTDFLDEEKTPLVGLPCYGNGCGERRTCAACKDRARVGREPVPALEFNGPQSCPQPGSWGYHSSHYYDGEQCAWCGSTRPTTISSCADTSYPYTRADGHSVADACGPDGCPPCSCEDCR